MGTSDKPLHQCAERRSSQADHTLTIISMRGWAAGIVRALGGGFHYVTGMTQPSFGYSRSARGLRPTTRAESCWPEKIGKIDGNSLIRWHFV